MKPRHLTIIPKTEPIDGPVERSRKRVKAMDVPAQMIQCPRCGGRELIETRIGVLLKRGRATGGTKCLLCAICLLKGERVVVR